MLFLRNLAFYSVTALWWVVYWLAVAIPVLAVMLLPGPRRRHWLRRFLLYFGLATVRFVWRPFFRVRFEDRTDGSRAPGVLVTDHRSAIDAFLVALPGLNGAQTVNGWPLKVPIIGRFALAAGYLDVTGWDFDFFLARAKEIFAAGDWIVAFPEGTRSESRTMNPFHSGIFRVAQELHVPVYMLCIAGNEFMPDRKFRFREFRDLSVRLVGPLTEEEVSQCATAYVLKNKVFRIMSGELASMDAELDHEKNI
ncbi:MAG: 1-acyl-sn-glycerol-3-phosphate acyltransferase [Lentisphaeria bacterium]|nr:1-acyl-sn-glycerol-3-phosphate acyltransferase [Lentisphaeria bacterium]